jgi:glycolate oxidase
MKKYGTLKLNEDVVVPRSRVPELIERVTEIGQRHETFVVNFGHAGDGNIHVNFMCEREDAAAVRRAREAVRETFEVAIELGGTISGEHGIGYVKAPYLDMAVTAATITTMKEIKRALDPQGILNPGKMFL